MQQLLWIQTIWLSNRMMSFLMSSEQTAKNHSSAWLSLSDHLSRVKRQWFYSFLSFCFFLLIAALGSLEETDKDEIVVRLVKFIAILSLYSIKAWITYHCSYLKQGTAWLMYLIIILPITFFGAFALIVKEENVELYVCLIGYLLVGLLMWFWVNCIRYRSALKNFVKKGN